jgi:hypothetical protein
MAEEYEDQPDRRIELNRQLAQIDASLKILGNGQQEIVKRLDKVNGSISTLYQRTDQNKTDLFQHVIDCPQKSKIETMGSKLDVAHQLMAEKMGEMQLALGKISTRDETAEAVTKTWKDELLYPLIKLAATGLVLILLYHANTLIKHL